MDKMVREFLQFIGTENEMCRETIYEDWLRYQPKNYLIFFVKLARFLYKLNG